MLREGSIHGVCWHEKRWQCVLCQHFQCICIESVCDQPQPPTLAKKQQTKTINIDGHVEVREAWVVRRDRVIGTNAMRWRHLCNTRAAISVIAATRWMSASAPLRMANDRSNTACSGSVVNAPLLVTPNNGATNVRHTANRFVRQSMPASRSHCQCNTPTITHHHHHHRRHHIPRQ
jgi:hypothetical protein